MNIGAGATNLGPPQSITRSPDAGILQKRGAADHLPAAADSVSKPQSPAERPDRPPLHTQPTASTDDPLQRLPETHEPGRQRVRARRAAAPSTSGYPAAGRTAPAPAARCPYDPEPVRQRDLDLLA